MRCNLSMDLILLKWPRTWEQQGHGPSRKLTTITLRDQSNKMIRNDTYTHGSVPHSTHIRESSLQQLDIYKEIYTLEMSKERETLDHLVLNGMFSSKPSLQDSGTYEEKEVERFQEPEVTENSKVTVSCGHNRTDVQTNSQRLTMAVCLRPAKVQDRQGTSNERRK